MRKLGFQVADRETASVLVELHNLGLFEAGLVVVGTLAHMAHLNDLGVATTESRTMDIDLGRPRRIEIATRIQFLAALQATRLPFVEVPALSPKRPATSAKLPGAAGLRVDVLAPGPRIGVPIALPELAWHAQSVPYYDYLLQDAEPSAVLAGGHCVPVRIPQVSRFIFHKLYASRSRRGQAEKAAKDLQQAVTLTSALEPERLDELRESFSAVPIGMRSGLDGALPALSRALKSARPEAYEAVQMLQR